MRLTGHTDYALRLLMYLGRQQGRLVTVQEIAAAHGISEHHLRKVAHRLGQAGLVHAERDGRDRFGHRLMIIPPLVKKLCSPTQRRIRSARQNHFPDHFVPWAVHPE